MLSLSNVSAQQAENYYEKDDYYTQALEKTSQNAQARWSGKGVSRLRLSTEFQATEFRALLYGQDLQGNALHAKQVDPTNHRAATDYTFSAPKSVSIAALIQRDDRVIQAHDHAVETALAVMEARFAQTRITTDSGRKKVKTGNLIAAVFRHETSREQDPQLHSHCVVINATQLTDCTWRSMSNDAAIAHQKLLGQIYQNELAFQLQQCGYNIEPRSNGQFELKGYGQKVLDIYSTRTQEIKAHLEKWEQSQGEVATPAQRKAATLKTRKNKVKDVDREVLLQQWKSALKAKQLQLPDIPKNQFVLIDGEYNAIVAVNAGVNHCSERDSLFRRSQIERFALEQHLGQQSFKDLQAAFEYNPELILAELEPERYTTQTAINRELSIIQMMQNGQGKFNAIASRDAANQFTQYLALTDEQRNALELSLVTKDQIMMWQGVAGSGKTYALYCLGQFAALQGYEVRGFAPSAAAAVVLGEEAKISSNTVASLLYSNDKMTQFDKRREIWIIDEAGLLSAKDCHALLKRAIDENARILLVGDTKQLSSVEAGNPFKLLQQHGIEIAQLEESRRQKSERLKSAVHAISKGELELGFQYLDQAGSIRAIKTPEDRLQAIVKDYLTLSPSQRANTLIIANTNAERYSITESIRIGLQAEGQLAADTFTLTSLKPKDWTVSQARYAKQYKLGDVIVPTQNYRKQQLVKGQQYEVIEIDEATNRLTVKTAAQQFELDPSRCDRKTVYKTEFVPIAPGDQMRWTRNDLASNRRNGQGFTIVQLDERGKAMIRDKDGKTTFIDLSGRQFADYSLVLTAYASQGKTSDRVLAALDGSTGRESFYVAVSRAKHELTIYTTDANQLQKLAARSRANENASDYLNLFTCEKRYAQNQNWTIETQSDVAADDSTDRGISIGGCVGERLATTLQGNCRTEASTSDLKQSFDTFSGSHWLSGINVDAIARSVTEFVERRAIGRHEAAIASAFESIATNLQQLEQLCQSVAVRDPELVQGTINPDTSQWSNNIELTLETAPQLTPKKWSKLTPRQQLTLVYAAQQHQASEPQGYTQVEQWVGQQAGLQRQFIEARSREQLAEATVKNLQERGERSLFNPFGATQSEQCNARVELNNAKTDCQHIENELKRISDRQNQRDLQDTARQVWYGTPKTHGTQHIFSLFQHPELKTQFQSIEQIYQQLSQWYELAQTMLSSEEIRSITSKFLDGQGISKQTWQIMQQDLARSQEWTQQYERE